MTKRSWAEIQGLDLLVVGGGGILYDGDAEIYLREVFVAHEQSIPVIFYAISAGPLALLLQPEEPPVDALVAEGVELGRHLVGFSVREPGPAAPGIDPEDCYALLANSADFMVERYDADVVFVPMERTNVQHSHGYVNGWERTSRDQRAALLQTWRSGKARNLTSAAEQTQPAQPEPAPDEPGLANDIVHECGLGSFPASDPPSWWAQAKSA